MKTKFVIKKTEPEPVQELLLTLEQHGQDNATIMLTLPNGSKTPLVGVTVKANGKLAAARWSAEENEYVAKSNHGARRIEDFYGD